MSGAMEERVSTPDYAPPAWLVAELRAAHAGEAGSAALCRGILAVARNAVVIDGARRQCRAADSHMDMLESMLPPGVRSRLLLFCGGVAWLAGALPALASAGAAQAARGAAAGAVERCYRTQIGRLHGADAHSVLGATLEHCREETAICGKVTEADRAGFMARRWAGLVGAGTAAAMALARRI
ncbi:demethoxyubiquinone hydroxylase family protein [Roseomonas hellenica]|uniref:Demethoxyubiquinone hydroxylase family protein n=1 Tax=Plastoroseomonas hellenica TaxID=2687306 RepID=A0ABS5F719_9PROT|nr:demethoxyubiquinone hydroxylase family protein [Plastoroseomonas hellenica]MBR0667920.1 demethoxyubiquinone hydroxylase family protein [Plastoroseomonas hellenica]